jgi:hypothetical protein
MCTALCCKLWVTLCCSCVYNNIVLHLVTNTYLLHILCCKNLDCTLLQISGLQYLGCTLQYFWVALCCNILCCTALQYIFRLHFLAIFLVCTLLQYFVLHCVAQFWVALCCKILCLNYFKIVSEAVWETD